MPRRSHHARAGSVQHSHGDHISTGNAWVFRLLGGAAVLQQSSVAAMCVLSVISRIRSKSATLTGLLSNFVLGPCRNCVKLKEWFQYRGHVCMVSICREQSHTNAACFL